MQLSAVGQRLMMRFAGFRAFSAFDEYALDVLAHPLMAQLHLLKSSTGLLRRLGLVAQLWLAVFLPVCGTMPVDLDC
jgi:hypothetical protein